MQADLYREELLEHFKNPFNFGKPKQFDTSSSQVNPFCGDEIQLFISFDKQKIKSVQFVGKGCAISISSASILTQYTKGKALKELTKFSQADMLKLLGVQVSETRKKCALLSLAVLQDCLYATKSKNR